MIGVGNVGGTLIEQLNKQKSYLARHHHVEARIVAMANSKKMLFEEKGVDLKDWKNTLSTRGSTMDLGKFIQQMVHHNLRNSFY